MKVIDKHIKLFHEGKDTEVYKIMGSHVVKENNVNGVRFVTWAPNAKNIWVVGDFNDFQVNDDYKMNRISSEGTWALFIPKLKEGSIYKYAVQGANNEIVYKTDPYCTRNELRPNNASIICRAKRFKWTDTEWKKKDKNIAVKPMNIYELHLGSWRTKGEEFLTYDELSKILPKYVKEMGYTHVELMPIVEYPLDASWGYQAVGYYSLTSRYGDINGFKALVNKFHENNIGVILDWVPGHFCKDLHGLYKFDGGPTYEYQEEWRADNKDWGTYNFDLGRPEVKSFLISSAVYWVKEFHIDGLRVDAVSNILYLDYGKGQGQWKPNKYGDNGNLEGIEFLKELNTVMKGLKERPIMIAEESTSWPNITKNVEEGGLGFDFKWNMGWMNDTLEYMQKDSVYRKYHHNDLTFSMVYNYSENFILPLSHDEVVHGKKSLIDKMSGDYWRKFANLRLLYAYMIGHPGKKLLFMGGEFAQFIEWREYEQLEWKLIDEFPIHKEMQDYVRELNMFYKDNKALWELDYDYNGFRWIDADNRDESIITFLRKGIDDSEILIFVCNFTPVVHYDYRIGVPYLCDYKEVFNSDDKKYGGSGQVMEGATLVPEEEPYNNNPYSLLIKVPPLATTVIAIKDKKAFKKRKEVKKDESTTSSIRSKSVH